MDINYSSIPQEQQQDASPMFPVMPLQSPINDVTLVTQTDPHRLVEELRHKLKCEIPVMNQETGQEEWQRPEGITPLLDDQGINSVMADVYGIVNQITILSNLSEDDVSNMVIELGKVVTYKLSMNWKEFEIQKSNLSTIVLMVTNMCYTAGRRGMDGGERVFLKTAVRTSETIINRPNQSQQMNGGYNDKSWWQFWK